MQTVQETLLPQEDYDRLRRSLDAYSELKEILADRSSEELAQDRIRLLALMRLVDTLSTNLAKISARHKLVPVDWKAVIGIKAHVTKVRSTPDIENLLRLIRDILPALMLTIETAFQNSVVSESGQNGDKKISCQVHLSHTNEDGNRFKVLFRKAGGRDCTASRDNRFYPTSLSKLYTSDEPAFERSRVEMELWFQQLTEEHRAKLSGRLRKKDDISHVSAYYELFFHEYFRKRSFEIEVEPCVSIYKPDFLITGSGSSFYLEVMTIWDTIDSALARIAINMVLSLLDQLPCDFLFSVDFASTPEQVDIDPLSKQIRHWLFTLSTECNEAHETVIQNFGLDCKIAARPRNGIVSSGNIYRWSTPEMGVDQSAHAVTRALKKNLKFAALTKLPIVLAVSVRDNEVWDDIAICQQLFGDVEIIASRDGSRNVKLLHRGRGFSADKNTSISAIIFCTQRLDRSRMIHDMKVVHNPWAAFPLAPELLPGMKQLVPCYEQESPSLFWKFPAI